MTLSSSIILTLTQGQLQGEIPFIEIMGNLLLFLLVFGMAAAVDWGSVDEQLQNKNAILTGLLLQFGLLPLVGFTVVKILNMNEAMGITLLVITSSPGGSYSNWWCSMFNGDLALSITMTTMSTIVSIFMLPINLFIYTSLAFDTHVIEQINWTALSIAIFVVILANILGLYFSTNVEWQHFKSIAYKLGNLAGISLIIFSVLVITSEEEADLLGRHWQFFVGVALPCISGLIISNTITSYSHLAKSERVAVSIECCYQNIGIASAVALVMFKGSTLSEALGVSLYYGIIEVIVVLSYCILVWKRGWTKASPNENIFTVITKSYELQPTEPPRDLYEILA